MLDKDLFLIFYPISLLLISFCFIRKQLFAIVLKKPTAPFVRIPKKDREKIVDEISKILKKGDRVYDLGSGDGVLLSSLYKKNPNSFFVGVEHSFLPWLLSVFFNIKILGDNFKLFKGDLFKTDIKDADYIFSYLMPKMMSLVYQKIKNESIKKVTLVSVGFPVPNIKPDRVFKIDKKTKKISLKTDLYFYEIN